MQLATLHFGASAASPLPARNSSSAASAPLPSGLPRAFEPRGAVERGNSEHTLALARHGAVVTPARRGSAARSASADQAPVDACAPAGGGEKGGPRYAEPDIAPKRCRIV